MKVDLRRSDKVPVCTKSNTLTKVLRTFPAADVLFNVKGDNVASGKKRQKTIIKISPHGSIRSTPNTRSIGLEELIDCLSAVLPHGFDKYVISSVV